MQVLITGVTGFIGSHVCVELLKAGVEIVGIDNFCNSNDTVLRKIEKITRKKIKFYKGDVTDKRILRNIFFENDIGAVIHFAALKSVGESQIEPLKYYYNNVGGTVVLCGVMQEFGCKNIVFSSSATVYGTPQSIPIKETNAIGKTTNPYGYTKVVCEHILEDIYKSNNQWSIVLLRYFNPIGAHESGILGEEPNGIPNNLMPYIIKVAAKELPVVNIFGNDYKTVDGTGVRDYIHVVDLAKGHVAALKKCMNSKGVNIYNLGTGHGYSVLELINTFINVNNVEIPFSFTERREGDIAECYADPSKAERELNWKAERDVNDMCRDSWNFYIKNNM